MTVESHLTEITFIGPAGTGSVAVLGDPETVNAVVPLAGPWVSTVPGRAPYTAHSVITALEFAEQTPRELIEYESAVEPIRRIHVSQARREVVVDEPDPDWRIMQVLRAVRHLLRWQAFEADALFLHGGMVSFDGAGVAFIGSRRSGKTSSIMAALANGGRFVVNDDLTVMERDGHLVGHGWPRTMAVRRDSALALRELLPGFPRASTDLRHPANRWEPNTSSMINGLAPLLWVDPAEMATSAGVAIEPSAPLRMVVLPTFDDHATRPELVRVTPAEAEKLISAHVEAQAVKYDAFLADWFTPHVGGGGRLLSMLAQQPVHVLRQRMDFVFESLQVVKEVLVSIMDEVGEC